MRPIRHVVVLDAADVATESAFWAELFGGVVVDDDPDFHCVIDGAGAWVVGVQRAPDHVAPDWPDGEPRQQLHLDLHVDDPVVACAHVVELGARPLFTEHDPHTGGQGFRVYADPAGHPFCIGWGHPDDEAIRHLADTLRPERAATGT